MLKLRQAGGNFNKEVLELLRAHHATDPHELAELLGPHLQAEDLKFGDPVEVLSRLHPLLRWWSGNNYLAALCKSGAVSLNIYDVLDNYIKATPYEDRSSTHFQESLWQKLLAKYLNYSPVEELLLSHLNDSSWSYEVVPIENIQKYSSAKLPAAAIV